MNRWHCQQNGCDQIANGVGGAIGLRAIGWYFRPPVLWWGVMRTSPILYCPRHHPDGIRSADRQAEDFQKKITP